MNQGDALNFEDMISVTELSRNASKFLQRLLSGESDQMVVLRNNKPAAVMLSADSYRAIKQRLQDLEDAEDIRIAEQRLAAGGTTTSLDEVFRLSEERS